MPTSDRRGVSLLVITVTLIILAAGLAVAVPRADLEVRRGKEEDLRFKLGEFKRAITKFARCNNRQPNSLDELLRDASGNRFLRRAYLDPITGSFDWKSGTDVDGKFMVHSSSSQTSISGIPYSNFR